MNEIHNGVGVMDMMYRTEGKLMSPLVTFGGVGALDMLQFLLVVLSYDTPP